MKIEIRPFEQLSGMEVYQMIQIREKIFVVEQNCPYLDADGYDPSCDIMLAWAGGHLIGTLRIVPKGIKYDQLSIGRVVVAQEARGKGVAYDMMNAALAFIHEKYGPSGVTLSAQVAVKGLYEKSGFRVISEMYLEDGIEHVRMEYQGK